MRTEGVQFSVQRSAKGIFGSATSGEGLLQTFEGTGRVWIAPTQASMTILIKNCPKANAEIARFQQHSDITVRNKRVNNAIRQTPQTGDKQKLLFDLQADPLVNVNIASSAPEIVVRFQNILQEELLRAETLKDKKYGWKSNHRKNSQATEHSYHSRRPAPVRLSGRIRQHGYSNTEY